MKTGAWIAIIGSLLIACTSFIWGVVKDNSAAIAIDYKDFKSEQVMEHNILSVGMAVLQNDLKYVKESVTEIKQILKGN